MTLYTMNRDLMSPDTEPTDEELQVVMREALNLVLARKKQSDDWMRNHLIETVKQVRSDYRLSKQ
jgi:hypothetical protein